MTRPWEKERAQLRKLTAIVEGQEPAKVRLLYFTAKWCSPCLTYKPRLLAWLTKERHLTKLHEVNADSVEGSALADRFMVASLPCLIAVSARGTPPQWFQASELGRLSGVATDAALERFWNKAEESQTTTRGATPS